jgi:hypothetical protein
MTPTVVRHALATLLAAAILACGEAAPRDAVPPVDTTETRQAPISEDMPRDLEQAPPVPADSLPERPGSIQDTLMLEGMPEVTRSTLVRAPLGFDLPFSTYLPSGINVQFQTAAEGAGVRFAAAFTGRVDARAYMHVRIYPEGTSRARARDAVGGFLRSRTAGDDPVDAGDVERAWRPIEPPDWALEAYTFDYPGEQGIRYVGRAMIARHGVRFLHVITHYPAEYGDGLGPRFQRILEHWRWEDTGEPLLTSG